jgi:hypothetical protein
MAENTLVIGGVMVVFSCAIMEGLVPDFMDKDMEMVCAGEKW